MKKKFLIDHIDPMGQGVSKLDGAKVDFILKTLPGESGSAYFYRSNGQLNFGILESVADLDEKNISAERITPICEHFNNCTACHYLHTNYDYEINLKKKTASFLSKKIQHLFSGELEEICFLRAASRINYRNRIQLHYDLVKTKLGFINIATNTITSVPSCLLPNKKIGKKLTDFYQNNYWVSLVVGQTNLKRGHIELYDNNPLSESDDVKVTLNQSYSEGGFTQINPEMNKVFLELIIKLKNKWLASESCTYWTIDLFGGDGNIGKYFLPHKVFSIDADNVDAKKINKINEMDFIQGDLFSLENFTQWQNHIFSKVDKKIKPILILDPPRSGFKLLKNWVEVFEPNLIFYVSCNMHTLIRDILTLSNYQIVEFFMMDFFPSTYHFETLIILRKTI